MTHKMEIYHLRKGQSVKNGSRKKNNIRTMFRRDLLPPIHKANVRLSSFQRRGRPHCQDLRILTENSITARPPDAFYIWRAPPPHPPTPTPHHNPPGLWGRGPWPTFARRQIGDLASTWYAYKSYYVHIGSRFLRRLRSDLTRSLLNLKNELGAIWTS